MKTGYTVGDVMVRDVCTTDPETKILDCARIMAEKRVGCLVVTTNEKVVGIITEQDIARKVVAQEIEAKSTDVREIMSKNVTTSEPHIDFNQAVELMGNNEIKHLPVTDREMKLLGIITAKDIIQIEPGLVELLSFKSSVENPEK